MQNKMETKWSRFSTGISNITFIGSKSHYNAVIKPICDLILTDSLLAAPQKSQNLSDKLKANLASITTLVDVTLYVASQCAHCPSVIGLIIPIAAASSNINLTIIDGTLATEEAAKDGIMSVPTLILNEGLRLTGDQIDAEKFLDLLANSLINGKPSALSVSSLKSILEDGKAGWIAQQILDQGRIFDGFIGLITHEIWSVRLGAMVVLEEIAAKSPELALSVAPKLLSIFDKFDIPTQGDILYALGEVGDVAVKDEIDKMVSSEKIAHSELLEAADAAIESIESRI
ncbi:MAG: thioredoxin family protein [Desulfamplus sp.]|nr:thioredoxin family protein [Desulfamplus sp.]MBF0388748.1 thioredoxin family protein [Desulfamplus sp.]